MHVVSILVYCRTESSGIPRDLSSAHHHLTKGARCCPGTSPTVMRGTTVVEVETSWLERVGGSIAAAGVGLVVIGGSVALLWWNERRTVRRLSALRSAFKEVVEVTAQQQPTENAVVHVVGPTVVKDGASAADECFPTLLSGKGGRVPAMLVVLREVQMYQAIEVSRTEQERVIGGGMRTRTYYDIKHEWSASWHDASTFQSDHVCVALVRRRVR